MLESELLCTFLMLFVACRCRQYSTSWLVLTHHDLSRFIILVALMCCFSMLSNIAGE